jgi:hypothetical protein
VEVVVHFLWLLAICHVVISEESASARVPYGFPFLASSPDEAALVPADNDTDFRFLFNAPTSTYVVLAINGAEPRF